MPKMHSSPPTIMLLLVLVLSCASLTLSAPGRSSRPSFTPSRPSSSFTPSRPSSSFTPSFTPSRPSFTPSYTPSYRPSYRPYPSSYAPSLPANRYPGSSYYKPNPYTTTYPTYKPSGFVRPGFFTPRPYRPNYGYTTNPVNIYGPRYGYNGYGYNGLSRYGVYGRGGWLNSWAYRSLLLTGALWILPTYLLLNDEPPLQLTYSDQTQEVCSLDWVRNGTTPTSNLTLPAVYGSPMPVPSAVSPSPASTVLQPGANSSLSNSTTTVAAAAVTLAAVYGSPVQLPPTYPAVSPAPASNTTYPELARAQAYLNTLPPEAFQNFDALNASLYNATKVFITDCMIVEDDNQVVLPPNSPYRLAASVTSTSSLLVLLVAGLATWLAVCI